jgi:hypothetical protein
VIHCMPQNSSSAYFSEFSALSSRRGNSSAIQIVSRANSYCRMFDLLNSTVFHCSGPIFLVRANELHNCAVSIGEFMCQWVYEKISVCPFLFQNLLQCPFEPISVLVSHAHVREYDDTLRVCDTSLDASRRPP